MLKTTLVRCVLPTVLVTGVSVLGGVGTVQAETKNLTATCAFDTNSGKPNPLGMRAYITAVEIGGDTTFTYEQFPANVNGEADAAATIAQERKLVFYKTSISRARSLMLKNSAYYESLIGTRDEAGFAAVNAVLRCQSADGQPLDKSGKIADLPDGTYRFWSGNARDMAVSDDELLKQGGVLVIFSKKGDRVLGNAGQIDGEAGVCLEGTIGGNTIAGFATTYGPMKTFNQTDSFEPLSVIPDGALRVRRGQKFGSGRAKFTSALYNLNGYSKLNLDDSKAPKSCK
jgi:hypothetical protein